MSWEAIFISVIFIVRYTTRLRHRERGIEKERESGDGEAECAAGGCVGVIAGGSDGGPSATFCW